MPCVTSSNIYIYIFIWSSTSCWGKEGGGARTRHIHSACPHNYLLTVCDTSSHVCLYACMTILCKCSCNFDNVSQYACGATAFNSKLLQTPGDLRHGRLKTMRDVRRSRYVRRSRCKRLCCGKAAATTLLYIYIYIYIYTAYIAHCGTAATYT